MRNVHVYIDSERYPKEFKLISWSLLKLCFYIGYFSTKATVLTELDLLPAEHLESGAYVTVNGSVFCANSSGSPSSLSPMLSKSSMVWDALYIFLVMFDLLILYSKLFWKKRSLMYIDKCTCYSTVFHVCHSKKEKNCIYEFRCYFCSSM